VDRRPRVAGRIRERTGARLHVHHDVRCHPRPRLRPGRREFPGQWPYTRGPHASMYRSTALDDASVRRFRYRRGHQRTLPPTPRGRWHRLSTAFDMPTLLGCDSDHPLALGEVGRAGVAVDTLADMEILFDSIDLGSVTTSMTINSAAPTLLAMYVAVADKTGVSRQRLGGNDQNDILRSTKRRRSSSSRRGLRWARDRHHPVRVGGTAPGIPCRSPLPHPRGGFDAAQELAFTLANGFAYVESRCRPNSPSTISRRD